MNRKGVNNLASWTVAYLIFLVAFLALMLIMIYSHKDGSERWEDLYAKQIAALIDSGEAGDEFYLDVTKGSAVGFGKKVSAQDMFQIDNVNNKVIVKLRENGATSFYFFKDLDVVDWRLEAPSFDAGDNVNRFYFKLKESAK